MKEIELELVYEDRIIGLDDVAITVDRNFQRIVESESLFLFWTEIAFPAEYQEYNTSKRAAGSLEEAIKQQSGNVQAQAALATRARELRTRIKETESSWKNRLLGFLAVVEEALKNKEDRIPKHDVKTVRVASSNTRSSAPRDISSPVLHHTKSIPVIREDNPFEDDNSNNEDVQTQEPGVASNIPYSEPKEPIKLVTDEELSPGELRLGDTWKQQSADTIWNAVINAELIGGASTPMDISRRTGIPAVEIERIQSNAAFNYYKLVAQNALPQFGVETQRGREIELRQRHDGLKRIRFERQIAASSPEEISDAEILRLGLSPQMRDPLLRLVPGARTGFVWYKVTNLRITSNSDTQMRGQRTAEHRDYFFDTSLQSEMRAIEKQLEAYETNTVLNVASGKEASKTKKRYNFDVKALIGANTPTE